MEVSVMAALRRCKELELSTSLPLSADAVAEHRINRRAGEPSAQDIEDLFYLLLNDVRPKEGQSRTGAHRRPR